MFQKQRLLLCILTILMWGALAPAWALEVVLPQLEVNASQSVMGVVKVNKAANVGALQFGMEFDPAVMRIVSVEAGELLPNAMVEFNTAGSVCSVALVSAEPISGSGNLVQVTIEAIGSSQAHSALTVRDPQAWDGISNAPLAVTAQEGAVRIAGGDSSTGLVLMLALILCLLMVAMLWFYFRQRKVSAAPGVAQASAAPLSHDVPNFCSHCGARVATNMNFCAQCGKALKHSSVPPAPTEKPL